MDPFQVFLIVVAVIILGYFYRVWWVLRFQEVA
jgi:hypothetical protein